MTAKQKPIIRVKIVSVNIQFNAILIDQNDNVYPFNMDPLQLAGTDWPNAVVREWPRALDALRKAEQAKIDDAYKDSPTTRAVTRQAGRAAKPRKQAAKRA